MEHNLKISVSKKPRMSDVITCKTISIRKRLLKILFGERQQLAILIPGENVAEVAISERGDEDNG